MTLEPWMLTTAAVLLVINGLNLALVLTLMVLERSRRPAAAQPDTKPREELRPAA